jgi:hypothetical protein
MQRKWRRRKWGNRHKISFAFVPFTISHNVSTFCYYTVSELSVFKNGRMRSTGNMWK